MITKVLDKKRIINDTLFEDTYKERVYDTVTTIIAFLKRTDSPETNAVLHYHKPLFVLFLFRMADMYRYRYVKKDIKLINNDLYFKFSNYSMFNSEDWVLAAEDKDRTMEIIASLIRAGVIKKRTMPIQNDKVATFSYMDFDRVKNYLEFLTTVGRRLEYDAKGEFKKKLIDGSIT